MVYFFEAAEYCNPWLKPTVTLNFSKVKTITRGTSLIFGHTQDIGAPRGRKLPADESSAREIVGSSR